MKKIVSMFLVLAFGLSAASIATYSRYESFSPCVWIEHDEAQETGLPRLVLRGRIHAEFLMRGIKDPDTVDCLFAWWDYRLNDARHGS